MAKPSDRKRAQQRAEATITGGFRYPGDDRPHTLPPDVAKALDDEIIESEKMHRDIQTEAST